MADRPHILVVNQHAENRGDEAALRAMLQGFRDRLENPRFTVVIEARDRSLRLDLGDDTTMTNVVMPVLDALRLVLYGAALLLRLRPRFLLTKHTRLIVDAYESADLLVSAPGGPYFGELYRNHEIVHWFLVWLARRYELPAVYYAPSAGPFRNRLFNLGRRRLFRTFDALAVREPVSADHLHELLGRETAVEVTADSALQQSHVAEDRAAFFADRPELRDRFLVAVSALKWRWPGEADPDAAQARYDDAVRTCLTHLAAQRPVHLLLFPQLYGAVHSDVPYLRGLAGRLPDDVSWEIVDPTLDSDAQQRLLAMTDFVLASRYHPQVFAVSAGVPGVCIYYEHKALGLMQEVGLDDLAFDIATVKAGDLVAAADRVLANHDELATQLSNAAEQLRRRSSRTTELAVDVLNKTAA